MKHGCINFRKRHEFEDVLDEGAVCVLDVVGVLEALNAKTKQRKELLDEHGVV